LRTYSFAKGLFCETNELCSVGYRLNQYLKLYNCGILSKITKCMMRRFVFAIGNSSIISGRFILYCIVIRRKRKLSFCKERQNMFLSKKSQVPMRSSAQISDI